MNTRNAGKLEKAGDISENILFSCLSEVGLSQRNGERIPVIQLRDKAIYKGLSR